jgi:hypothetical protein
MLRGGGQGFDYYGEFERYFVIREGISVIAPPTKE